VKRPGVATNDTLSVNRQYLLKLLNFHFRALRSKINGINIYNLCSGEQNFNSSYTVKTK
jgi:hypothetical protein